MRCLPLASFGIDTKKIFRAGGADHHPADFAKIEFDAVEVFATNDGKIEKFLAFAVGEIGDSFFFLARLHVEVNTSVVMFAKFFVERGEQFTEGLAVPGHEFGEEKRRDGGVALGEIEAEANAAAFFTADQNVLFEHQFTDVFKADRNFVELAIEFCCELVNEFGDGEGFRDVTRKIAHAGEVPDEERKNLVRIDEGTIAVDCADAVTVAVGGKASVIFSGKDGIAESKDVRLDGLGIDAAETRIAYAANFVATNTVTLEQFWQEGCRGAVHGVGDETEFGFADAIPVNEFFKRIEIGRTRLERLDKFWLGRKGGNAARLNEREFCFDLRDDGGKRAAAVPGFVLDAVPLIGVVTCGNDDSSGGSAFADELRDGGRWAGLVAEQDRSAGGAYDFSDEARDSVRGVTMIVADDGAFARVFLANDVARDGFGHDARVGKREIFGDDAAPAVSAELNRGHGKLV